MYQWLTHVFDHPDLPGCLIIAGKTMIVYVFLIAGLRILGKREMGQMNVHDLVLIVVLGNAVQNAMMNNDNSLAGGLIAATTLLVLNWGLGVLLRRSRRLEHLMIGHPLLLVHDGIILDQQLEKEGITREQLKQALREHGLCRVEEARLCVLELDGSISVVPFDSEIQHTKRHFRAIRTQ